MIPEREWDGQVITEPGIVRGVPMERYHGALCDGPSISSSGLRTIEGQSPLHYWATSYLNANRPEEEAKDYFDLGKAVHKLLLSEDGFADEFVVRPTEWKDWKPKASQVWRDEHRKAGYGVLTPSDLETIQGIANRLVNDEVAKGLLEGRVERTIAWRDPMTGVWIKSRPDVIPADTTIADLKTTTDASRRGCERAITDNGYLQQMALAVEGMNRLAVREGMGSANIEDTVLLFVEKKYPYAYNIKPLDQGDVYLAMRQNRRAIDTFAACLKAGDWPTYADSTLTLSAPAYWTKRLEDDPELPENRGAA